jgi:integrase
MSRTRNLDTLKLEGNSWNQFLKFLARKEQATRKSYEYSIRKYMNWLGCKDGNTDQILNGSDSLKIQEQLIDFIDVMRTAGRSQKALRVYYFALKGFLIWNDVTGINWMKIEEVVGEDIKKTFDEAYSYDQIEQILKFANLRGKVLILMMLSSGIRSGAIADMKLRDIQYIQKHKLYQIKVYNESDEHRYTSFLTPEASAYLQEYLNYRERICYEKLIPTSPLIREEFNSRTSRKINKDIPRPMTTNGIVTQIFRLVYKAGIRSEQNIFKLGSGKRHSNQLMHGLRKTFKEKCMSTQNMNPVIIEYLMGHLGSLGLEKDYYQPKDSALLAEYLKAVPSLTVNSVERERLRADKLEAENSEQKQTIAKAFEMYEAMRKEINEIRNERNGAGAK